MPDKTDMQFEQYLSLGTSNDPLHIPASFAARQYVQTVCHFIWEIAVFAVTTALMTLGLPLCFFLAISGWDLIGLFTHLDNLATRYLEADAVRRLAFSHDLKRMFFAATALITALRMPGFISRLSSDLPERSET